MKYYLLEADNGNRIPMIINQNDVIHIADIREDRAEKIPNWNFMRMDFPDEGICPDVLHTPFFAVSKECMELINLYQPQVMSRIVKLWDPVSGKNTTYVIPILPEADCLSEECQYNNNKSILLQIVLRRDKIPDSAIFRIEGFSHPYVIARLDLVESMIRRKALGVLYQEVEIKEVDIKEVEISGGEISKGGDKIEGREKRKAIFHAGISV